MPHVLSEKCRVLVLQVTLVRMTEGNGGADERNSGCSSDLYWA